MRPSTSRLAPVLAGGALLVLLSACGSTASTAPVETAPASGEVAADGQDCAVGPPARGPLNKVGSDNDGVVGTIYNDSKIPIWAHLNDWSQPPCRINVGQSAVYGAAEIAYIALTNEQNQQGQWKTGIKVEDPYFDERPVVTATGVGSCIVNIEQRIWQGYEFSIPRADITGMWLPNDEAAANEYTGKSTGTDDWARVDFRVRNLTYCGPAEDPDQP